MINRYPGTCGCGAAVAAGGGEAFRDGSRWAVRCETCSGARGAAPEAREIGGGVRVAPAPSPAPVATRGGEYALLSGHPASAYQAAVFEFCSYGQGSAIVEAVAGAGKTTTIKNALRYLPERASVQLFAFNVEAAGQLKAALAELEAAGDRGYRSYRAGTFHSVGFGALARRLGVSAEALKARTDDGKVRKILKASLGEGEHDLYGAFAARLVGFAKGEGVGCLVPDTEERWWALVEHHGLYLDSEEAKPARGVEIARAALAASNAAATAGPIDFDDMLYLPILWKLRLWQNDVVFVDEAQDTNPVRRAILRLALRPDGRLIAVGDPRQGIYGFTGASTDAIELIEREFAARRLPLTVSYRCARAVVERAQAWVPHIEPAPGAPEGEVRDEVPLARALAELTDNDAVLCRQTAPLVALAYGLIARGCPCRILGREIGEGLVNLVERQKARGLAVLVRRLEAWRDREAARFTAKGDGRAAEAVEDRAGCLLTIVAALPEGERTVPALIARVRGMFDDRGDAGVLTLATVHRAKGQEWDRVAILRPELMPSRAARQDWQYEQEVNLQYVAATRARRALIYCADGDGEIEPR